MKKQQCGGMPVLMAGVLLGSGLATMAMLPHIRKTRVHNSPVLDPVPVTAGRPVNHLPQWDDPVSREGQPDWDRNPQVG